MVTLHTVIADALDGLLLADAAAGEKLLPPTRAAAIMALIGIALLGMLLVVIILLGGHWVRRQGTYRRGPVVPPDRRPILSHGSPDAPPDELPDGRLKLDETADPAETVVPRDTRNEEKRSP